MGTASPHAAAIGATMRLVLSPTPPVECLSTAVLPERPTEKISPESRMAKVSAWVSSCESPRIQVWLPTRGSAHGGGFSRNFLTLVCVYAMTLIGQVTYWNCFGLDRSAALFYLDR